MHYPQISNSRPFVQESQCHPKIQKKLYTQIEGSCAHQTAQKGWNVSKWDFIYGPIDRFQCQGNKFLA